MDKYIGAALISSAANIASNLFTNSSNSSNVDSANQAAVDLWREQSAYNTPKNQMSRAVAAGLNPNLVATNVATTGAAANAPQMLAKHTQSPVQLDPLTAAQVDNIKADTELKLSQSKESLSRVDLNNNSIRIAGQQFELNKDLTAAQIRQIDESIKLIEPQINKLNAETSNVLQLTKNLSQEEISLMLDNAFNAATFSDRVDKIVAELDISRQQYKLLLQQYLYNPRLFESQIALNNATANLNNSAADLNKVNKNIKDQEYTFITSDTYIHRQYQELESDLKEFYADNSKVGIFVNSIGRVIHALSPFADASASHLRKFK